jgi:hypothetical protein
LDVVKKEAFYGVLCSAEFFDHTGWKKRSCKLGNSGSSRTEKEIATSVSSQHPQPAEQAMN